MKPLDIVVTPKGGFAMIVETNNGGTEASIKFFGGGNPTGERNAWWTPSDGLKVIDTLPRFLASSTHHPFGKGAADVELCFPLNPPPITI